MKQGVTHAKQYDPLLRAPKVTNQSSPETEFLLGDNFAEWNTWGRLIATMMGWIVHWPQCINRDLNKDSKAAEVFEPFRVAKRIGESNEYKVCPAPVYPRTYRQHSGHQMVSSTLAWTASLKKTKTAPKQHHRLKSNAAEVEAGSLDDQMTG